MLRDAEHFKTRIGSLDGADDAGDYLVNLVKGKSLPKPKANPTTPPRNESEKQEPSATRKTSSEIATPRRNNDGNAEKTESK